MSSFSGIHIGQTALFANQLALDVIGKNIAHANDPNYARQRVEIGAIADNGGVSTRVEHAVSISIETDLLREGSSLNYYQSQDTVLEQVEAALNESGDVDLSSALDAFYEALEELTVTPNDPSLRQNVNQVSQRLVDTLHLTSNQYQAVYDNTDREIGDIGVQVDNRLTRIADLNVEIVRFEAEGQGQKAVDLRDERGKAVRELSQYMDLSVNELSNGSLLIQADERTLVINGEARGVQVIRAGGKNEIRYKSDNALVTPKQGELAGLLKGRDVDIPKYVAELNTLARSIAWEVNKVHNQGRGLVGLSQVTAETQVDLNFIDKSLDKIVVDGQSMGNYYKVQNGVLTLEVRNKATGSNVSTDIDIDLISSTDPTSLMSLAESINEVGNLKASISNTGRLEISSDAGFEFFISEDSSNVSSVLGLNNYFSKGTTATAIGIRSDIMADTNLIASANSTNPGDNTNLLSMIATREADLGNGLTLGDTYRLHVTSISSQKNLVHSLFLNQSSIYNDVLYRQQSYSGVSLDDEAAKLLIFQNSYQASARYMSVQQDVLDMLLSLI